MWTHAGGDKCQNEIGILGGGRLARGVVAYKSYNLHVYSRAARVRTLSFPFVVLHEGARSTCVEARGMTEPVSLFGCKLYTKSLLFSWFVVSL